jgi:hypothetical protein
MTKKTKAALDESVKKASKKKAKERKRKKR